MAGLVDELVEMATNESAAIGALLRRALVVAQRLEAPEIKDWIESELAGFADKECPPYRKVVGQLKVRNPFHGWQPVHIEDQALSDALCVRHVAQSAIELSDLLDGAKRTLIYRYPGPQALEIMRLIGTDLEPGLYIPRPSIVRVLGSVRDNVLRFALDLDRRGIKGEGQTFTHGEKALGQSNHYNTTIHNHIGSMVDSQLQQYSSGTQQMGMNTQAIAAFTEAIRAAMEELRLSKESQAELEAEITTIQAQLNSPKPKGGVVRACLTSAKTILEGAMGNVAAAPLLAQLHLLLPTPPV